MGGKEMTDSSLMPFGKYKGEKMANVMEKSINI